MVDLTDTAFERSITALTALVILGIIAGVLTGVSLVLLIIAAIVVEFGIGGFLLHLWGKSYMSRR